MPNSVVKTLTVNGVTYDLKDVDSESYAPKASPALTGTPTAPTATSGTNTTQIATTAFVQSAVTSAVGDINSFDVSVVQSLPTTNIDPHTIYFISNSGSTGNIYDEYMYVNNNWEKIGTTEVDLSGYLAKTNTTAFTPSGDYNPATKKYVDDAVNGFSTTLSGLTDTTITSPNDGDILIYDGTDSKWENVSIYTTVPVLNKVATVTISGTSASFADLTPNDLINISWGNYKSVTVFDDSTSDVYILTNITETQETNISPIYVQGTFVCMKGNVVRVITTTAGESTSTTDCSGTVSSFTIDMNQHEPEDDVEVLNLLSSYGYPMPIVDSDNDLIADADNNIILG